MKITREELGKTIDHTILKAEATAEQITKLCEEAREYNFASVCVNGSNTALCARLLKGSGVDVCVVVGFPLGSATSESKAFEAGDAIGKGADEIDMVLNVGALKSKDEAAVLADIEQVCQAAKGKTVKVIIEACYLTEPEKRKACELAKQAGAHFVKTSTGFGTGGATIEDVQLMKSVVGDDMRIKAAGGIRSFDDAVRMIEAGANRLGTSSGIKIMEGYKE